MVVKHAMMEDESINMYNYDNQAVDISDASTSKDNSPVQDDENLFYYAEEGVSLFLRIGVVSEYVHVYACDCECGCLCCGCVYVWVAMCLCVYV